MSPSEFAYWLMKYYKAAYNDVQQVEITKYIRDLSPQYLDSLKEVLTKRYSNVAAKPPDIAIFERLREEAVQNMKPTIQKRLIENGEYVKVGFSDFVEYMQRTRGIKIEQPNDASGIDGFVNSRGHWRKIEDESGVDIL